MSIAERIKQNNARLEKVHVPEWETDVWVKRLSVADVKRLSNKHEGNGSSAGAQEVEVHRLIVLACVDEERRPIFTEDDCRWLAEEAVGPAIGQLVEAIERLNPSLFKGGMEELEKNSETTPPSASSTS